MKKTKKLFIIGNGFDLHHKLKTNLCDYKEYELENNPKAVQYYRVHFSDLKEEELWSNMECILGKLVYERIEEENQCLLPNYNDENVRLDDYIYEINEHLSIQSLSYDIRKWIETIETSDIEPKPNLLRVMQGDSLFLTFNYTDTLEHVYSIADEKIIHIHGYVKNTHDDLQFGHNNIEDSSYLDKEIAMLKQDENNDFSWIYIETKESIKDYFISTYKKVEENIITYTPFWEQLSNVNMIYILGHSLNPNATIDFPYFRKIVESININKIHWIIAYHTDEDYKNSKQFMVNLKNNLDNVEFIEWTKFN